MNHNTPLIMAMAAQCRTLIQESIEPARDLPQALHPRHLLWMCDRITDCAEDWPATKLHRWIGYIQCGMLAHRMLDLAGAKAMFDEVKNAYGASGADQDLLDHLDPNSTYQLDIGGQG